MGNAKIPGEALRARPRVAVRAMLMLRRILLGAADTVVPPSLAVFERVAATGVSQVIGELARLGVADLLQERPMTGAEIAERTGTNADAMQRTMRAAVAVGIFTRTAGGRFANNRLSGALRSGDASVRSFAAYFTSGANMRAWMDFGETLRTGKNAFERVHGTSVWEWFDRHPEEREAFAHAMTAMTLADAPGIATTYPFREIDKLCDVGGGRGTLLSEILLHHRHLAGVLCDSEGVLESARALLRQRGVERRVELVAGSFFEGVPRGADAYLLKNILHDWDDERALAILRSVRAAMEPGKRVLVCESIVESDSWEPGAVADVQMMVMCCEGRERGRAELERLVEKGGFRVGRVFPCPTPIAVIEGIAA